MHTVFHRVRIAGIDFEGALLPSGPHLLASLDTRDIGDVPLGHVSCVRRIDDETWTVCKYGDTGQVRIRLHGFVEDDVVTLVEEFGLSSEPDDFREVEPPRRTYVLDTRSGTGLLDLLRTKPSSVAPNQGNTPYLGDWRRLALGKLAAGGTGRPS